MKDCREIFVPCYDIINSEIYFFNFYTEDIIDRTFVSSKNVVPANEKTSAIIVENEKENAIKDFENYLTQEDRTKLKKSINKFKRNWEKMKLLTKFNLISSLPGEYKNYFKRPFFSRFFLSENKKLYSFNSCKTIPHVLTEYTMIINIKFDEDTITSKLITNKVIIPFETSVSLTTLIDSLIRKAVDDLEEQINESDIFEELNKHINADKLVYVLKAKENEEYLYGDSLIGTYQFIRGLLRQHEKIYCYLKLIPMYKVSPALMSFPPILTVNKEEKKIDLDYVFLITKYLKQYNSEHGIIYRLFRPEEKNKKRFLKRNFKRIQNLTRFTESCDCFYPLNINLKQCDNLFTLKYWFEDEEYNKNEMLIPNLKYYKEKKLDSNSSFLSKCFCKSKSNTSTLSDVSNSLGSNNPINVSKEDKLQQKLEKEKKKKLEKEQRIKALSVMSKKHNEDEKLQKEINNLRIEINNPYFYNYSTNIANCYTGKLNKCLDFLSSKDDKRIKSEDKVDIKFNPKNVEKKIDLNHIDESDKKQEKMPNKFKIFVLDKYILPFSPCLIRFKITMLYGSYAILSFRSEPFIFQNKILINDKFIFDSSQCLISYLPFETRIAVTIEAYDKALKKKNYFVLGSCQVPLYRSDGQIQNGVVNMRIWPNISVSPRFNNCGSFNLTKKNNNEHHTLSEKSYPHGIKKNYLSEITDKLDYNFKDIIKLKEEENTYAQENDLENQIERFQSQYKTKAEQNNMKDKDGLTNRPEKESENLLNEEYINSKKHDDFKKILTHQKFISPNTLNENDEEFCSISIEFPKFSAPLIYSQNSSESYRDYLQIKYKSNSDSSDENDFDEIRKLYGNSQKDIPNVVSNFEKSDFMKLNKASLSKSNSLNVKEDLDSSRNLLFNKKTEYPTDIWRYIRKTLPLIIKTLKKGPLDKLEENEIVSILICRDYISNIPSALVLFLRAINWLNPLQVSIAHLYIKKWSKLEVEDAISLLDARFPDTETREFAISMLRDLPDELVNMYMLQLCQCLLYETFLINPLSDFLIERSLKNPKLIGNAFFWNSRVSMKNPLFSDRLTVYLLQIFMCSGDYFLNNCFEGLYFNDYLEFMTYYVKLSDEKNGGNQNLRKENVGMFLNFFMNDLKMENFTFPIDPIYFGVDFHKEYTVFNSKMLPICLQFNSREGDKKKVIFKIGDDLRQDVLTLQIFNIMDKLWLDNNLDLKLLPYKVCPTEIKAGFIECLTGSELDKLQQEQGITGALNKDLIVQFLRDKTTTPLQRSIKFDNFIKSLAGYVVATCVIGIGDRHPGNIMIKENGIFYHIDFGHILGNFKSKFFIKRERSPFVLTPEMANAYVVENKEEDFKADCVKAFNILRNNANRLINMFIIMSTAGMPELCSMNDVKYVKKMLALDLQSDEDAGNYFIGLIKKSKNDKFRLIDNIFHNLKH